MAIKKVTLVCSSEHISPCWDMVLWVITRYVYATSKHGQQVSSVLHHLDRFCQWQSGIRCLKAPILC